MKIGLFAPASNPFATPEYLTALGRGAEERGFHTIWLAEHVVLFDEYASRYPYAPDGKIPAGGENGILDPFDTIAFLAAVTREVRLGTGICLVPQRNPVYTAKDVATVDWLSGGRLDFGVGIGWLAEEFEALGVPFERRGTRCREYLEVMRRLWCEPVSEYQGEFYSLLPCRQYPKPIQQPHPPIWFGGESDAALRRVADLGQGWYPFSIEPEELATRVRYLERLLADRGRKRADIQVNICPYFRPVDAGELRRYQDAGADQITLLVLGSDPDTLARRLDELAPLVGAAG